MSFFSNIKVFLESEKSTAATAEKSTAAIEKQFVDIRALQCSDENRRLLVDALNLIDKLGPDAAVDLMKAFNTANEAEHAGDQESFDFALSVLAAAVQDAPH